MTKPAKKKVAAAKPAKAAKPVKSVKSGASAKPGKAAKPAASWSETMKKALEIKRGANQGPDQPKPRDSGTQKVKKDAF